jgi:hypothetical protein
VSAGSRSAAAVALLALAACVATPEAEPEREVEEPAVAVAPPTATVKPQPPAVKPPATAVPHRPAPPLVETRSNEVEVLLADFERMRRMTPVELARELDAARLAFSQTRSDASRVRLAMLATMQGPGEETRALELLDPLVKTPGATLHGLAFLLSSYIHEQRRLAAAAQGLQQNVQGLQQSNQTLQQNVHALQQKLDALRTLERALSERGEPAPRRR